MRRWALSLCFGVATPGFTFILSESETTTTHLVRSDRRRPRYCSAAAAKSLAAGDGSSDGRRDDPPPNDLSERRREEADIWDMSESRREEWAEEGPSVRSEPDGRRAGRPLVTRGEGAWGMGDCAVMNTQEHTAELRGTQRSAGS